MYILKINSFQCTLLVSFLGGHKADIKEILDILKAVHQVKWKLVRVRQEHSKSYKEVCSSVLERCRFLLNDIRPFRQSQKHQQMSNVNVLQTAPKLKMVARKILQQNRSRSSTSPGKNPLIREILQRLFYSENKIISCNVFSPSLAQQSSKILQEFEFYSHLSNS